MNPDELRDHIRERYGSLGEACCGGDCNSTALGYTAEELATLPEGTDLGLGCGNPTALAALKPGEVVLDLGSGAGIDCLLAAHQVGPEGRVIGVDMTPEMLTRARANAAAVGAPNVEFRLGEIEHLPLADESVDVVISNCVINLSPDKGQVYREALRVLRPGGRFCVSDVIARRPLPDDVRADPVLAAGCVGGALEQHQVSELLTGAGFDPVEVVPRESSCEQIAAWSPGAEELVVSADIVATRPGAACCGPDCC